MHGGTKWLDLILGVFAVSIATSFSAQGPANNRLIFAESQVLDAPKEVRAWLSFGMRDFDADGYSDELYVHDEGLVIAWGTPVGIDAAGRERSIFKDEGTPMRVMMPPKLIRGTTAHNPWDFKGDVAPGLPQFWVEWGGPKRMSGFTLENREIKKVKEVYLGPDAAAAVTGGGLVFGPDENGQLLLDEFGVLRVLTRNCPSLSKLMYQDLDDDGHRDLLIHTSEGEVGVAFGHKGELKGLHWLEHTSGVANMVLTGNLDGTFSLIGYDAMNLQGWAWRFGKGGWTLQALDVPELFEGMTRLYAFPMGDRKWLWLAEHFPNRCLLGALVEGLEVLNTFRIEDTEFVGAPQLVDGNGDGTLDLVYANAKSNQLVLHNGLQPYEIDDAIRLKSSHELLFWSPQRLSTDLLWPYFRPYPSECLEAFVAGVSPDLEIQHFRCESDQLFARGETTLLVAQPTQDWHDEDKTSPLDSGSFALKIPHFRPTESQPVEVPPEEWSHVMFSKSKSGKSTLYINGEKASEGWLRNEVEALRILFLGCSNLGARFRFFHGAIDEVAIWNRDLTQAEAMEAFEARRILKELQPQLYFDFESSESNAFRWGSHALVFENGEGEVVSGVHGQAMLFDGKQTYASLFTDIPDGDLTISLWVKPSAVSDPGRQTFLGIYGDWNLDFDLLEAEEWNRLEESRNMHMHAERIELPENGFPFRYREEEYYLSAEGLVFIRAGLDWKAVQTNGADPLSESDGLRGTPWIADGRLNAVFGNCHIWFQFDAESMNWATRGRLNPLIKGFNFAISGLGGTVFIRREGQQSAWWKPKNEDILHPLSLSAFGEETVGMLADWDGFWWLNERGDLDRPNLLPRTEPIPFLKPDFPLWVFMAGSASIFLLLGARYIPRNRLRAAIESGQDLSGSAPESELGTALEIYKDLLFRLSEDAGEGVDTTNLDVIFDIHHIETDETRRSRRSRMVKELNDWYASEVGRQLIRREIDPDDRRRRIYVVDEGLGELLSREIPPSGNQA